MKKTLRLFIFLFFLLLSGCANWALKERCEKTNWFEYSQSVAFEGRYLEEDGFIKDCKSVDRISAQQTDLGFKLGREKMCQYDEIFKRGREGTPVFFKFCDGLEPSRMRSRFDQGLREYCTPQVGYTYGKSGKIYQKVCTAQEEKTFLPPYFKGRKEYILDLISSLETEFNKLRELEDSASRSESRASREYSSLPSPQECSTVSVYDEGRKENVNRTVCREASYIQNQRSRLSSELSEIRNHLAKTRAEMLSNQKRREQAQIDLNSLPQVD